MSVYIRPIWHSVHTAPAPGGNNLIYREGAKRVKEAVVHRISVFTLPIITFEKTRCSVEHGTRALTALG